MLCGNYTKSFWWFSLHFQNFCLKFSKMCSNFDFFQQLVENLKMVKSCLDALKQYF